MENKKMNLNKMVLAGLFAAIALLFTMVIRIPSIGGTGYVNIGDTAVLISAWLLGGWYGAFAAGLGSALADILSGYTVYALATFIIKFAMAFAAYLLTKQLLKLKLSKIIVYIVSSIVAEIIMIAGYFVFEAVFLGLGASAIAPAISNVFQGITNIILALVLIAALEKTKSVRRSIAK